MALTRSQAYFMSCTSTCKTVSKIHLFSLQICNLGCSVIATKNKLRHLANEDIRKHKLSPEPMLCFLQSPKCYLIKLPSPIWYRDSRKDLRKFSLHEEKVKSSLIFRITIPLSNTEKIHWSPGRIHILQLPVHLCLASETCPSRRNHI